MSPETPSPAGPRPTPVPRLGIGTIVRHFQFGVGRAVACEHGWIDVDLELAPRWAGGTLRLIPGKSDIQPKEVPIETFFKKIVGIRDRLRVLEQKLNVHPALAPEEKLEFQGYITRCYGSLTTFNVLFGAEGSRIQGTG